MIENRLVAGIVAGIPVSLLCLIYTAVRRDAVVALLTSGGAEAMSPEAAGLLAFAGAALAGPMLGLAGAVVYGWMPSTEAYLALAFVIATLLSLAAVATHTPMAVEKVALNYAVAAAVGALMPRLLEV